jgi:hypothetical protein
MAVGGQFEREQMSIKEMSLKLAALSLIADEAKKAKDRLRAELQIEMDKLGADRVKAELGDQTVAFVMTANPKFKWEIVNEKAFVEWVKTNFASEIVESVREGSVDVLLAKLQYVDDLVIDHNGERVSWAVGNTSEPYLMTKFAADGRDKLKDAMMSNAIDPIKMLELE